MLAGFLVIASLYNMKQTLPPPPPPKAHYWVSLYTGAAAWCVMVVFAAVSAGRKRKSKCPSTEANDVAGVKGGNAGGDAEACGFDEGMMEEETTSENEMSWRSTPAEHSSETRAKELRESRAREEARHRLEREREEARGREERVRREREREEERVRLEREKEAERASLEREKEEERARLEQEKEEERVRKEREAAEAKMRELRKAAERARAVYNNAMEEAGNIRVVCRVRSKLPAEDEAELRADDGGDEEPPPPPFEFDDVDKARLTLVDRQRYPPIMRKYRFAAVLSPASTQAEVFEEMAAIIDSVVSGVNVTVLAYGQTGSGKTHTMDGSPRDPGLIGRTVNALFHKIQNGMPAGSEVHVKCSALEIYLEQIHDLLASNAKSARVGSVKEVLGIMGGGGGGKGGAAGKLEVREEAQAGGSGYVRVHVPGLVELSVSSAEAVEAALERARASRATAATAANERSSRSHAVTTLHVTVTRPGDTPHKAKLHMVDLAGSERLRDSRAKGEQLKEAQSINRSLAALGDVIYALRALEAHIPYRNSKLTALLRDSIGGNNKVLVVVACSPLTKSASESMRSLDFAERISETVLGPAKSRVSLLEMEAFRFESSFETVPSSSQPVLSPVRNNSSSGRKSAE